MAEKQIWTVLDLINRTALYFKEKAIDNPRLNAEHLLGHTLQMERVQLYLAFERPVSAEELDIYRDYVKRRSHGEPLQYIIGSTEFMGYHFRVKPGVLIPRPETELLVEMTAQLIKEHNLAKGHILDIGTGSGCIAISLKKLFPDLHLLATDISEVALNTALENAKLNNVDSDLLGNVKYNYPLTGKPLVFLKQDIKKHWPENIPTEFDFIISNPPYISTKEFTSLSREIREYEPETALSDGADGLTYYKLILDKVLTSKELKTRYLIMEMSGTQPDTINKLAKQYPGAEVQALSDYNHIPRILLIKVNP